MNKARKVTDNEISAIALDDTQECILNPIRWLTDSTQAEMAI